ncbi:MAG: hypothetical protein KDC53_25020, partial [Saprospiraceae bacterium]|nr:hypothetical protein [Saprospiraceae bacterium]
QEIDHPSKQGGQTNLATSGSGDLYSSWLEYPNDSLAVLKYSVLQDHQWSVPTTIAQGVDWFVNWADFPSLAHTGDFMLAHWLQYSGDGAYEYDVNMSLSSDGIYWSPPLIPHRDGVKAEHGFVSLLSDAQDQILAIWLDGRYTAAEDGTESHGHEHEGSMTLRSARIGENGSLSDEQELDDRVCDCCQTGAVMTPSGPVVVYRNRTEDEIRDIYLVRKVQGKWQEPYPVHNDGWQIGGCPVNGPAIAASDDIVAVVWYTMADDQPSVKLAISEDDGANFSDPILISAKDPLGRVDLEFVNERFVLVSWIEQMEQDKASIMSQLINIDNRDRVTFPLKEISSERRSGFPRLAKAGQKIYLSWTEITGENSRIKTAEVLLSP